MHYAPAGTSAIRSAVNRPVVHVPIATGSLRPVVPVYSPHRTYIHTYHYYPGGYSNTYLLSHHNGYVNGYLLGRMVAGSHYRDAYGCCYDCGCGYYGPTPAWYYDSYVPYRYSYYAESSAPSVYTTPSPANTAEKVDVCTLARWNLELPFSELPNMILRFIASENISGSSDAGKARFMLEVLNTSAETYGNLPEKANIFQIDKSYDLKQCNIQIKRRNATQLENPTPTMNVTAGNNTTAHKHLAKIQKWRSKNLHKGSLICRSPEVAQFIEECHFPPPEEPIFAGIAQLKSVYLNTSGADGNATTAKDVLSNLITAAKNCYPADVKPDVHLAPCLDFSLDAAQLRSLSTAGSVFGNEDLCRKFLTPDVKKCTTPPPSAVSRCSSADLLTLNVFARNFYLCEEPVDSSLITKS
ncbi:uncharacterized protein LOC129599550 [Paramacrobiotus metropolitanus]|uniref:uncharacterized protein LOC129599550 n=1 Tax=Paramacrobiotus metropolitanus TaxID=2943436 RepID=UPI002445A96F|nr:uncharacterized protein LOC129599550 [Paramacrobiotus metropolitanus]